MPPSSAPWVIDWRALEAAAHPRPPPPPPPAPAAYYLAVKARTGHLTRPEVNHLAELHAQAFTIREAAACILADREIDQCGAQE